MGGGALLNKYYNNSLRKALQSVYPEYKLKNSYQFTRLKWQGKHSSKSQVFLFKMLQDIFPGYELHINYNFIDAGFHYAHRYYPIQYDIFIPSLSIAFEYQGEYHYYDISVFQPDGSKSLQQIRQRDLIKEQLSIANGITLFQIPYWWDKQPQSLLNTIQSSRLDLNLTNQIGTGIPKQVPHIHKGNITGSVTSAKIVNRRFDPSSWWIMNY